MANTSIEMIQQGTATDLLTTELNSLATATLAAAGTAIENVQATANWNGYPYATIQLTLAAYSGTPAASSAIYLWFLKSIDGGSTYEDGSASVQPARAPDVIIPVRAVASGPQVITVVDVKIPVGFFKPLAKNANLGLSLAASGNKITALPNTDQGV